MWLRRILNKVQDLEFWNLTYIIYSFISDHLLVIVYQRLSILKLFLYFSFFSFVKILPKYYQINLYTFEPNQTNLLLCAATWTELVRMNKSAASTWLNKLTRMNKSAASTWRYELVRMNKSAASTWRSELVRMNRSAASTWRNELARMNKFAASTWRSKQIRMNMSAALMQWTCSF